MEKNIKFKVINNIGRDSKRVFGGVGTIYETNDFGFIFSKNGNKWGYETSFKEFQKYLKQEDRYQTEFELINKFEKSDLKEGCLVRIADRRLVKLEQMQGGKIGLFEKNGSWVTSLYDEEEEDDNDLTNDYSMYTIDEVYGYSNCSELYDTNYRDLLWKREGEINFKEYSICEDDDEYFDKNFLHLVPNTEDGYKTQNSKSPICMGLNQDKYSKNFDSAFGLSISNAKELIKSLQEIVDYVEDK